MQVGLKIVLSAGTTAMHAPDITAFLRRLFSARHTRGLFLQLFTLCTALSLAMHLFRRFAVSTDAAGGAAGYYISPRDMDMASVLGMGAKLFTGDADGRPWLPLALAYLVAGVLVQSVAYIAAVSAAVVAYSGERHTLPSFLRKVANNGSLAASAFALCCALRLAVVLASAAAVHVSGRVVALVVVPGAGVLCAALVAVQAVAVAASVAEPAAPPGRGVGPLLLRACRLMRGKYAQGFAAMGESGKLGTAFWVLGELVGMAGLPATVDAGVRCLLATAERMASLAVATSFYFECRKRAEQEEKDKAGHQD